MGKKNKKVYREQFETPIDIDVFNDDDALDALIKDYLSEKDSRRDAVSQQNNVDDVMGRILSKMTKREHEERQTKPIQQTYTAPTRDELPLQPTLGMSECLNRVVLTDKTGAMSYSSTNKYKRTIDNEYVDPDTMGKILTDLEVALLIDSTPSAVFRYGKFVDIFKNIIETNTKRFIFIVDEDFNYQPDAHVYCFFNGTGFYNSCSDVVSKLSISCNLSDFDIINIFKDLVIYHGTTSFIARDAAYEFDDFINSKYNSDNKIIELIMNDRFTKTSDDVDDDPDLAQIFNFRRLSDLEYIFSPLIPIDDDYSISVDEDDIEDDSSLESESNIKATTTSITIEHTSVKVGEEGVTNDNEPFHKEPEVYDSARDSRDEYEHTLSNVGSGNIIGEQEPQKEIKEDRGRDNGIIDADPETFDLKIEEEEPATPTPKVNKSSSGSMVIPVMRG